MPDLGAQEQRFFYTEKSIDFAVTPLATGATLTWFTVSGQILIRYIYGWGASGLGGVAGSTITLGVVTSGGAFIAATDHALIVTNSIWISIAPSGTIQAIPTGLKEILVANRNIISIGGGAGGNINSGILTIACEWRPANRGGILLPA